MTKEKFDLLSYLTSSWREAHLAGARHGKSEEQFDDHQATLCLRKAQKNQCGSVIERFQKQDSDRESPMANGWTEEKCRYLDQLALEDKSYTATRRERQRYKNNWKLTINAQGHVSPMDKREDYLEAVKAMKNLQQQAAQASNPSILPNYQTRQRPFLERHRQSDSGIGRHGQIHLLHHQQHGGLLLLNHHLGCHQEMEGTLRKIFVARSFAYKKWRFPCKRSEV